MNPTRRLHEAGQSLWLDYIRRSLMTGGRLERYLEQDGLRGMTSNPSIFEQAIAGSDDYDEQLRGLLAERPRLGAERLYELLAIDDIRLAADALRPVFEGSGGDDGYVSFEVSPYLAYDTAATVSEVRRLWGEVGRPNLMLKVPATDEGIPAIETLIGEGFNVNVTLMFSLADYEAVANAYVAGLERLSAAGDLEALSRVASVASFFVSRVDGKVDPLLAADGGSAAMALRGRIAIANSKRAYHRFQEIFEGERFAALRSQGARVQRVLWGSTSTKDPAYRDVLYVEELIGPHTVNTVPPKTIDAFRDHGEVRRTVTEGMDEAAEQLAALGRLGIDLGRVTAELQREGVASFAASFDQLLAAIEGERRRILGAGAAGRQRVFLGRALGVVSRLLEGWQDAGFGRRLWAGDRTLWSAAPVDELNDRMGWLTLPDSAAEAAGDLEAFAAEAAAETDRVFLLGMGGSSLAPEVFQRVFGEAPGRPRLTVVDSTHPEAVAAAGAAAAAAGWERTLFVVSSKSGGTVETLSLFRWFWARAVGALGEEAAGRRFVAVTDPGSRLEALARERGFRAVFTAPPEVGGRYSALTPFGLLPAALVGVDVGRLLDRARGAAFAFGPDKPALVNEALYLGGALGELAYGGGADGDGDGAAPRRDKLVFWTTPSLAAFPDWLEQLIAESTGKDGTGIVPVVVKAGGDEPSLAAGADRVHCALSLADDGEPPWAARLDELEAAGHPVVRIRLADRYDLGAEMLRWEIAVAAAGAALGIHPFDQPDVELAKRLAGRALAGELEAGEAGVAVGAAEMPRRLGELLAAAAPGSYVAVHAYLPPDSLTGGETDAALARLQRAIGERTGRVVTVGYGPRFLHSTGQLHKGGPDGGLFLQLVDGELEGDGAAGEPVPEGEHSFAELIRGQAAGDRQALVERGRRVLTLRVSGDRACDLARLAEVVEAGEQAAVVASDA